MQPSPTPTVATFLLGLLFCAPTPAPAQAEGSGLYSLPRTQDDLAELLRARQEIEEGTFDAAVQRLHELLQYERSGVVPTPVGIERFYGIRHAVIRELRELPSDGKAAYERLVARQAQHLLARPFVNLRREELVKLARSYPVSKIGIRARLRLGDLALERGDGFDALRHYRAALDVDPAMASLDRRRAAARSLSAMRGSGDEITSEVGTLRADAQPGRWPAYGGGGDGARTMPTPIGRCAQLASHSINAPGFADHPSRPTTYPMHAVGDLGGVFVNDGTRIWALDALGRGDGVRWRADGPMVDVSLMEFDDVAAAINPDMILTAAVDDDIVVCSLMVPNDLVGASQTQSFKGSINIIRKISSRRLFAYDRATGKLVWSHWDRRGGSTSRRFNGHDACGPPLIEGDTLYVPTHDQTGAIAYYLSAYDLHTGAPKWRSLICSSGQEVNMFGNARHEFAAAPLALHEGVVYGTTNLGVCFAANAEDGSIRWVTGYEPIPLPRTRLRDQQPRRVFFANNPPVIADGVLAVTPLDSAFALGIDIESGRTMWRMHHAGAHPSVSVRWLLGAIDNEFVFSGLGVIAAKARPRRSTTLDPETRVVASAEALGEDAGYRISDIPRGALTDDRIYFLSSNRQLHVLDKSGNEDVRRNDLQVAELGNLLLADGIAVTCRAKSVSVYANLSRLQQEAERDVRRNPDDPSAHLRLATIALAAAGDSEDAAQIERAIAIYERGLEAAQKAGLGAGSTAFRRLADGHFKLSLRRAQRVVKRERTRGLQLLRACRDQARRPEQWIRVQLDIIAVSGQRQQVEQLDAMRELHGREQHRFSRIGRVPVAAYCLWRSAPLVRPRQAVRRCQDLMEQYPSVVFGEANAADLAREKISFLIEKHGQGVYADVEEEAERALTEAGTATEALRAVARRFPHANAAGRATSRLIEIAIEANDLDSAIRVFATTRSRGPGILLRLMLAAERGGNLPLAHALAERLRDTNGADAAQFGPDDGKTFAQFADELARIVPREVPAQDDPRQVLARLKPTPGSPLQFVPAKIADGFPAPKTLPLFAVFDDRELRAFDLSRQLPTRASDASYDLMVRGLEIDDLIICGETAIVSEHERVRGFDVETGTVRWTLEAERRRQFVNLGVNGGLVVLFSRLLTGGDGGELFGIEPVSGTKLFHRVLPETRDSFPPVRSPAGIWYWETTPDPVIVRVDPLTGADSTRIPLSADARRFLGLDGRDTFRIHDVQLQTGIVADARKVVIPMNPENNDDARPRCIALDHRGKSLWKWNGKRGEDLGMVSALGERTVIATRRMNGPSGITVLDKHGQVVREIPLRGRQAHVRNWRRSVSGPPPCPEILMVVDTPESPQLTCVSLVDKKPHFRRPLEQVSHVGRHPVFGDDFLVFPTRSRQQGRRRQQSRLQWIDFSNPLDRKVRHVPTEVKSAQQVFEAPLQLMAHEGLMVIETPDGLVFVGDERKPR